MPSPTDTTTTETQSETISSPNKSDYEARFIESLKRLNAPKWFNNESTTKPDTQHSNTKLKYDKLKQRFRPSHKKNILNEPEQSRTRHKSEDSRHSFGFSVVDIELDNEYDDTKPKVNHSLSVSKSAYSLDKSPLNNCILASKSNDLLNAYTRSAHERYLEELTGRGLMKRSKSSYSTNSVQARSKLHSDRIGQVSSNSSKSTSNLVRHRSCSGSKWYQPKPLQLPEGVIKKPQSDGKFSLNGYFYLKIRDKIEILKSIGFCE